MKMTAMLNVQNWPLALQGQLVWMGMCVRSCVVNTIYVDPFEK